MDISLEKFSEIHFSEYFKLVSNIDVMAMITERAIPYNEACRDFKEILDDNARLLESGYYRIADNKHGNFIGLAKLAPVSDQPLAAELGYMLLPEYWGRGIASRVVGLLVEQASKNPGISALIGIIDPSNLASRKILTNNGFFSIEFRDFNGLPGEILQRTV